MYSLSISNLWYQSFLLFNGIALLPTTSSNTEYNSVFFSKASVTLYCYRTVVYRSAYLLDIIMLSAFAYGIQV